jgi:hypothetical protein
LKRLNFLRKKKLSNADINNFNHKKNRGFEFILTGGKKKRSKPFGIIFQKLICFFNRKIQIYFEFTLNVTKNQ